MLLDSITAVIIGGTRLTGGKGTIQGVLLGVVFVGMISNALNILNIPAIYHDVFKGLVIIGALLLDQFINREK